MSEALSEGAMLFSSYTYNFLNIEKFRNNVDAPLWCKAILFSYQKSSQNREKMPQPSFLPERKVSTVFPHIRPA